MSRLGRRVLVVDLDAQAKLTGHFLQEEEFEPLWTPGAGASVAAAVQPIVDGLGDIAAVPPRELTDRLWLLPGDLARSQFEEQLAAVWPRSFTGTDPAAVRTTTASPHHPRCGDCRQPRRRHHRRGAEPGSAEPRPARR